VALVNTKIVTYGCVESKKEAGKTAATTTETTPTGGNLLG